MAYMKINEQGDKVYVTESIQPGHAHSNSGTEKRGSPWYLHLHSLLHPNLLFSHRKSSHINGSATILWFFL